MKKKRKTEDEFFEEFMGLMDKTYGEKHVFVRYSMAAAAGKGSQAESLAYAKRWNSPAINNLIKGKV